MTGAPTPPSPPPPSSPAPSPPPPSPPPLKVRVPDVGEVFPAALLPLHLGGCAWHQVLHRHLHLNLQLQLHFHLHFHLHLHLQVNGEEVNIQMKLDDQGAAFFVEEVGGCVGVVECVVGWWRWAGVVDGGGRCSWVMEGVLEGVVGWWSVWWIVCWRVWH